MGGGAAAARRRRPDHRRGAREVGSHRAVRGPVQLDLQISPSSSAAVHCRGFGGPVTKDEARLSQDAITGSDDFLGLH